MELESVVQRLGEFTWNAILVTEAEPHDMPGPRILWCNPAFTNMTGYTLDEVRGKTPRLLQGPDTDPEARRVIRERLAAWQPVRIELKNYTKAGVPFWVDLSILPVADEHGWYRYWVSVQQDVTARRAEQRMIAEKLDVLRNAQTRMKRERAKIAGIAAVAENAQDLITVTDTEFRILWANKSFLIRTGYELEDVIGRPHCEILNKTSSEYSSREIAIKAIIGGACINGETLNHTFSGETYWADTRVSVQRDEQGTPIRFIVVERDVTEQRAMSEELRAHRDHLSRLVEDRTATCRRQSEELATALEAQRALNEQQIQFMRMASHELRTPLSIIAMAARRARKAQAAGDAEDHEKRMEAIDAAIARLGKLIDSTLNLAKVDAGKLDFNPEPFDFRAWIVQKVDEYAETSDTHRIEFTADDPGDAVVMGDVEMLAHVFDNLVGNARKYAPHTDVVEIALRRDGGHVRVDVRDHGVGIPRDEIPKLFKRYFRASTSTGTAGTGIGLSVVKEFVDRHGGLLAVDSDVGKGATFTVRLPLLAAAAREGAA